MQNQFYLDSCIWLNLFKKEGNEKKGIPYWKLAQIFLEKFYEQIVFTGFVLKELKFRLNEKQYEEKAEFIKTEFAFIKATEEDYILGRKLESEFKYEISFFDCMHVAICKRIDATLITRDKLLINFSKKHIKVLKPEEILFT